MGNNRYNKTSPQPLDYTPKKVKQEEVTLQFEPCCICHKKIVDGYWGRYGTGGVCSKGCDIIYQHSFTRLIDYIIIK
jgi:hypothetical protein